MCGERPEGGEINREKSAYKRDRAQIGLDTKYIIAVCNT